MEKTAASNNNINNTAPSSSSAVSKGTFKRDVLRGIESKMQHMWEQERLFQCDAPDPAADPRSSPGKFMVTFPYPYMNGRLHLGHSFSLSKAEFAAGFERMCGKRVLFPFAFHCTGMPIKAAADKLRKEMELFGCPPKFPDASEPSGSSDSAAAKSKVAAKTGGVKYQWQIMEQLGIPSEEISRFADPVHWTQYFPPAAEKDLRDFGAGIDWRRSFISTDLNPFYDAFIQWQFRRLRAQEKITFGKRYCIWSPLDGQPCMDHDRASGEGVGPKEYTAIKLKLVDPLPGCRADDQAFLIAATLRPETMYGLTNCWVGPDLEYGIFRITSNQLFVCTERAALNLSFQGFSQEFGRIERVGSVLGTELIGKFVQGPLTSHSKIPILPMMTVSAGIGTGIVTSVPSSSADDFVALRDLREKEALRRKFNLSAELHVDPFAPIPVVRTLELGDNGAEFLVKELAIRSQNDRDLLDKAKERLYKEEFYNGQMIVGDFHGMSVQEAKPLVRKTLIAASQALLYYEPEKKVVSRSGDDCVVCLTDQWFIAYGEESWRAQTEQALARMNCFSPEVRNQFEATLQWMQQWACSRSFGLGTRLPWDKQYLIESLSDSTIYMAFYTIAHILHQGSLDGSASPNGITPGQMTDAVFDYIFGDAPLPTDSSISPDLLKRMRSEFRYFYPLDLRVSGKDLVPNHLTFFLYNHVALFDEDMWPRGVHANGHLLLNSQKMSKSTGVFMTMGEACERFGADATRIALADAGDSLEDANFVEDTADKAVLRLYSNLEGIKDIGQNPDGYRPEHSEYTFADKAFAAEMNVAARNAVAAYKALNFRDALQVAFYGIQNARDYYRDCTVVHGSTGMHLGLMRRYAELCCQLMAPITPHYCDYIWREILGHSESVFRRAESISDSIAATTTDSDSSVLAAVEYLRSTCHALRTACQNTRTTAGDALSASVYIATSFPRWQEDAIAVLRADVSAPGDQLVKALKPVIAAHPSHAKKIIPFVMELKRQMSEEGGAAGDTVLDRKLPFNETAVIRDSVDYLCKSLGLASLNVHVVDGNAGDVAADVKRKMDAAEPGRPSFRLH